ncbi:MAG: dihydrofolate reductase [Opitutus sp.]
MAGPLNIIVACSENRVIGRAGKLPWRIPEDWEYFKSRTTRATVILGRKSFISWKSILDEEREAIVLTKNQALTAPHVQVAHSLDDAITQARRLSRDIYICGGQKIFEDAIKRPDVEFLHITRIHATLEGDRFFPEWNNAFPRLIDERISQDENYRYSFCVYGR